MYRAAVAKTAFVANTAITTAGVTFAICVNRIFSSSEEIENSPDWLPQFWRLILDLQSD